MTNLTAAVIVTLSTNWTTIGTFRPSTGLILEQDVQEGRLSTNTIAIMEWRGQRKEVVLESQDGPVVGERKLPPQTIIFHSPYITNYIFTNMSFGSNPVTLEIPLGH